MTDDTERCGDPTSNGEPCTKTATRDDGRCHLHTTIDDQRARPDGGRPSKYTPDRAQRAIEAATRGKPKIGCARSAGVGSATLDRWLDEDPQYDSEQFPTESFRAAFTLARAQGEDRVLEGALDSDDSMDPQTARFILASSFGYKKAEKREVEHSGGIDGLNVTINGGTDD